MGHECGCSLRVKIYHLYSSLQLHLRYSHLKCSVPSPFRYKRDGDGTVFVCRLHISFYLMAMVRNTIQAKNTIGDAFYVRVFSDATSSLFSWKMCRVKG